MKYSQKGFQFAKPYLIVKTASNLPLFFVICEEKGYYRDALVRELILTVARTAGAAAVCKERTHL